ncbi:MAG: DUF885 domain-containing protein, partial [bacterium]
MKRVLAWSVACLLGAGAVFLGPTLFGKPWSIDHFFVRSLVQSLGDHPMLLSYARPLDTWGLDFYSDDLDDYSLGASRATLDQMEEILVGLQAYDRTSLRPDQQLSYDILEWLLEAQLAGRPFLLHSYPLNQFDGAQSGLPDFMVNIHKVADVDDARNYLARVAKFEKALEELRASVQERAARGLLPPRFVLEAVRAESAAFAAGRPEENILYTNLDESLGGMAGLGAEEREAMLAELSATIEESVQPAYDRLSETLAELARRASEDAGAWKHPEGEAYYRWALRWHTTTDKTPDEIHRIGLIEVERIHGEMRKILEAEGLPSDDPIATLHELGEDPRFLYPDSDEGRAQILEDYRRILTEASERLPELFGRLPEAEVAVERVPVFREAGAAGAYYNPPSLDGTRPGIFYANLRDVSEVHRFGMRTLAFHEALPGHHLQIALTMENGTLPLFRRFIPMTAFIEGWALYSERLALEHGFHTTPYDELGALSAEVFRAARLVVDTGIHAKGWSRE